MDTAFDPAKFPKRVNLGCGFDHRPGFLNVDIHDFHDPDLLADVTQLDMLPSGQYEEVVAQDVLEHLPRTSTVEVLKEWSRLLREGGLLHLRVPSVIDLAEMMKKPEHQEIAQQELFVQCLFGTQAYTEDTHFTTFTEPLLRHYLAEASLAVKSWGMRDGWLFEVDAIKVAEIPQQAVAGTPQQAMQPRQPQLRRLTRRLRLSRTG
jgi:predicted SAM-dependent methyltransferase